MRKAIIYPESNDPQEKYHLEMYMEEFYFPKLKDYYKAFDESGKRFIRADQVKQWWRKETVDVISISPLHVIVKHKLFAKYVQEESTTIILEVKDDKPLNYSYNYKIYSSKSSKMNVGDTVQNYFNIFLKENNNHVKSFKLAIMKTAEDIFGSSYEIKSSNLYLHSISPTRFKLEANYHIRRNNPEDGFFVWLEFEQLVNS